MRKLMFLFAFLSLVGMQVYAQKIITGTVTGADDGGTIPGVSVVVKGTTTGTVTDIDGKYSLSVPDDATTLVFSFVGMKPLERQITGTVVNASLETETVGLDEVVVTAIGIKRSEKTLGYSATTVGSDDITKTQSSSMMNSLQGKIAGVNISSAGGAPGSSTKVILRGYNSIGGNNQPLFVIDGVPLNNSANNFDDPQNANNRKQDFGNRANDVNPDDIENITILKGASATALYGSRAASGVIMITTKSGKNQDKLKINYSGSVTLSNPLRLPQSQNTFGQGWSGHFAFEENGSWGPKLDGKKRLWGNIVDNSQQWKPFSYQEDALKDFYETGIGITNSISLSGGKENSNYYVSYANTQENGIIPTDADSYKRNAFALRGSTKGKNITASSSLNYIKKNAKVVTLGQGGDGTTVFQELIQIPVDMSLVDFKDYNYKFNNLDNYFTRYAQNPYWAINENGNDFIEDRMFGNFQLDYQLTGWLSATWRTGTDIANSHLLDWVAIAKTDPESPNGSVTQITGAVTERSRLAREINSDFILKANNKITDDLGISTILGYNVNSRYYKDTYGHVTNLTIPEFYNIANSSSAPTMTSEVKERRLYGVFAQVDLSFKEYLFFAGSVRNDWSSTLPEDANSFLYYGVNASFLFTEAIPEIKSVLPFGKIRVSYGQTGNDADPYSIKSTMQTATINLPFGELDFPINGINAYTNGNILGNPNLKPEISTEFEVGTDLRFFDNRFGIDFAYYSRESKNQILSVPLPNTSGYTRQIKNIGLIENKGVELMLSLVPVKTKDFKWDINYTYTKNNNKVIELEDGLDKIILTQGYDVQFVAMPGKPLGVFMVPKYRYAPDGRIIVNPSNGLPVTDAGREEYGNAQNDFVMGLTNSFTYKNFNLSFVFDYRKGGKIWSYSKQLNYFVGNATNTTFNERQPYLVPNSVNEYVDENGVATYVENFTPIDMTGVCDYYNSAQNEAIQRDFVIDRSYVKFRELSISYNVPNKMLSKLPIANLSVSIFGRNLLLWTPEENDFLDPEVSTYGNDLSGDFGEFAAGPSVRAFGFSLKIGF